jgi:hypothetical protein
VLGHFAQPTIALTRPPGLRLILSIQRDRATRLQIFPLRTIPTAAVATAPRADPHRLYNTDDCTAKRPT